MIALSNPDNQFIIRSAFDKYGKGIEESEADYCRHMGLWEALQQYDQQYPDGQKFTTYLYDHVKWMCLNTLRDKRREQRFISLGNANSLCTPETSLFLKECLGYLPDNEKKVLYQVYFEKRTQKEIAEMAEEPVHRVRIRIAKALTHLRDLAGVSP